MYRVTMLTIAIVTLVAAGSLALAGQVTICQCNILASGTGTNPNTGNTIRHDFAVWLSQQTVNPPISVIGVQEIASTDQCDGVVAELQTATSKAWTYKFNWMGRWVGDSGDAVFWRTDLVESRSVDWYLGCVTVDHLDNGYDIKLMGQLLALKGLDEAFGVVSGKHVWNDAVMNGVPVTESVRQAESVKLKNWIRNGGAEGPGMSNYPGTVRVITTDLNSPRNTATYSEMNLEYTDPGTGNTVQSAQYFPTKRYDYIWWDYDANMTKQSGGFVGNTNWVSSYFGSDHRAVYGTVNIHAVDLTPPSVGITTPAAGAVLSSVTRITAQASDISGILQVQFLIDGSSAWTDTAAPFEFDWNASAATEGAHTITAVATDASSNRLKGQSAAVPVFVSHSGTPPNIADAKRRPDGDMVALPDKVVTASFGTYFYMEEPAGLSGIKVAATTSPAVGTKVYVYGRMNTLNGEREISAFTVTANGSLPLPEPVGLTNRALGGDGIGSAGAGKGVGPNNVGSLVTCWGRVTAIVSSFYMYIDDGSGIRDGYGYAGLRVDISGLTGYVPPAAGSWVRITGISSTSTISGKVQRRLKARYTTDISML